MLHLLRFAPIVLLATALTACGGSGGSPSGGGGELGLPFEGLVEGAGAKSVITGSVITLFAVGNSGYGVGAVRLAQVSSSTSGNFKFGSYSCPKGDPATQTYVTAVGGNTATGSSNSAIGLLALTGPCNQLGKSTFVVANELTTAAAEWALAQFTDSTGALIGAPSTNPIGLGNAATQAISDLAVSYRQTGGDTSNTGVPASFLPWSIGSSNCTDAQNCDGLQRLDTLANILASCVDSSGPGSGACGNLFSLTGSSGTTLAVARSIVANPTSNVMSIYNLQGDPSSALYQPALPSAPDDFTLGLNFVPPTVNSPQAWALDLFGNVFVANSGGNNVIELVASNGYSAGTAFAPAGAGFNQPSAIALDMSGNVFVANSNGSNISELTVSSGYNSGRSFAPPAAAISSPTGIALDSTGNVLVSNSFGGSGCPGAAPCGSVSELTFASGYATGLNFAPALAAFAAPMGIALDGSNDVLVANSRGNSVAELTSGTGFSQGFNFTPAGALLNSPNAIALDSANNAWVTNGNSATVSELTASSGYLSGFSFSAFASQLSIAVDSANNVFVAGQPNAIVELTASSGYANSIFLGSPGAGLAVPAAIALDESGNFWAANLSGGLSGDGTIGELLGLATPVQTPLQVCLSVGHPVCVPSVFARHFPRGRLHR